MASSAAGQPQQPWPARRDSTDSFEQELDWLIEKDEQENKKMQQAVKDEEENKRNQDITTNDKPPFTKNDAHEPSPETLEDEVFVEPNNNKTDKTLINSNIESSGTTENESESNHAKSETQVTFVTEVQENSKPSTGMSVGAGHAHDNSKSQDAQPSTDNSQHLGKQTQNRDSATSDRYYNDSVPERINSTEEIYSKSEGTDQQQNQRNNQELAQDVQQPHINESVANDKSNENTDYEMTEDQRKAAEELEEMRLFLGEEPPPEYNVAERVRQLNEELRKDPPPEDDDRERTIQFKDNLVDLVAPPPEYSDEEEEVDELTTPRNHEGKEENDVYENDNGSNQGDKADEKVLIEKDGKFYYVNASDVAAVESGTLDPEVAESNAENGAHQPRPPPGKPRPSTAGGAPRRSYRQGTQRRAQSAQSRPETYDSFDADSFQYQSPYGLSPEEKKRLQQNRQSQERRERDGRQQKEEEEREKREDNDSAFGAWLKKKREQAQERRRKEREEKNNQGQNEDKVQDESSSSDVSEERDPEGAFKEWCQVKKEQQKKKREEERQRRKAEQEQKTVVTSEENRKAFKQWLKKKNEDIKRARKELKEQEKLRRLLSRRSRKSQQLAFAIRQAQAFRYVDYYGYRY